MNKIILISISAFFISFSLFAQETVKVMSYNLLNFANYTSYCTSSNNPHQAKAGYLATIIENQQPDILAVCEMGKQVSATYVANYILGNSLNVNGETRWQAATPTDQSGSYLINGLFYDKNKFRIVSQPVIQTNVRDINIYKLECLFTEGVMFNVVVMHLKAGSSASDAAGRAEMVTKFMDYLQNNGSNENYIVVGDLNTYTYTEQAFQKLINPANTSLAFYDPINKLGNWNNEYAYRYYHTQSTHDNSSNDCFSYGGMNDRFDFILISSSIKDGTADIKYVDESYWAVGQDGNRFNSSINSPTNTSLPTQVINALYNMSDHLPIVADFDIGENNSVASLSNNPNFYANVINPTNGILQYQLKTNIKTTVSVNIYTGVGQKIFSKNIKTDNSAIYSHDISNYANGIYIMTFEGDGIFQTYKIVKQ